MIPVETLLADHELYHSDFQMDALITVRSGCTTYGCYKQALRELWKRYRGLRELYLQQQILEIDIEELAATVPGDAFAKRRQNVERWSKRMQLNELQKNITETEREFLRFYGQAAALKTVIGTLDAGRRAELDQQLWEHRIKAFAAIDYMTSGRLSANTFECLQACPGPMRQRIANDVLDREKHDRLVTWFLSYSPEIPKADAAPAVNVRRLIECSESMPSGER